MAIAPEPLTDGTAPTLECTPKQVQFVEAVLSGKHRHLAIGGGIRGTKTFAVLITLIILCRIYPRSRWAVVRRDLPTLRKNVVPSMNKLVDLCGGFVGKLKQDIWTYPCKNGSEIILFPESYDTDKELERFKGLEVNGFVLEEASELHEKTRHKCTERAGSYIIPVKGGMGIPKQPPPINLYTFNPCPNWPKQVFFDPYVSGTLPPQYYYLPSTAIDNPYLSDEVKQGWTDLPEEEYRRFVLGEWTFSDDPNQLIKFEWILKAQQSAEAEEGPDKLGWDVARYGDDEIVEARIHGNVLTHIQAHPKLDLMAQANIIAQRVTGTDAELAPISAENVHIDAVGLGAGVVDKCRELKLHVREIIAGASPIVRKGEKTFFKFKNLRTQMWWEFREKLRLGKFVLPEVLPPKLLADLLAIKYDVDGDKFLTVWSKDKIKEETGRSTDWGDALAQAAFDLPPVIRRAVTTSVSQSSYD